jgi:cytochrome c peroxidase
MQLLRKADLHRVTSIKTVATAMVASWMVVSPTNFLMAQELKPANLREQALEILGLIPDKMPGSENDTPERIALGERLFHEKLLSVNKTQSCNTCHDVGPGKGGVDNEPTSPGAFGKRGGRNSPTVLNAGFHIAQFWDGRAETLEEQAQGPILNPIEMAMPAPDVAIERLSADSDYPASFKKAFPEDDSPISYENVSKAIAAFERTLITKDRFDDFQRGSDSALTEKELKGLNEFLTVGCTTCHFGPLLGGNNYKKVGILEPYEGSDDKGRFDVTEDEFDMFVFKVPSLRNIALTDPYFHDGKTETLDKAVRTMARIQLGAELKDEQTDSIIAFLNALTDKERAAVAAKK